MMEVIKKQDVLDVLTGEYGRASDEAEALIVRIWDELKKKAFEVET